MIFALIIEVIFLVITILAKKNWVSIVGFILDLPLTISLIVDTIDLYIISTEEVLAATIMMGWIILITLITLATIAVNVIQATYIKKFSGEK